MQNYSLSVQHQLSASLMVDVAYVGNIGRKLIDFREFNPAIFGPGATLANTNQRRRLAPVYESIGQLYSDDNSSYNGLQVQVNRRFSRGLTFTIAYTYSRAIDEVRSGGAAFATVDQAGAQDPFNRRGDRGLNDFDRRQRWVTSFLYEFPFLRQKDSIGRLLGGWELGGALTLQSGGPFTVMAGRDNSLTAVGYDRPDLVGNPELEDRPRAETILRYFNTDAFRANATGTYGNTGRNTQTAPGQFFLDVSLSKTFPLWEAHSLQFRVDAFNLPNYPNFNEPNATLTASAFGQITGASSGRIMQLSLKYAF